MADSQKTDAASSFSDAGDLSVSASSDILSASLIGISKKQFIMMPPEDKLTVVERRAQDHEDKQEFDACIQDLVRCVALTKLVFGASHLKLAQAHIRLAKAYLKFKGCGLQAQEHATLARELLPSCSSSSTEKLEALLTIHLTHGEASLMAAKYPYGISENILDPLFLTGEEAESSFLESERLVEELHQRGDISQEDKIKTIQEVSSGLYRVYKTQNRPDKALGQCEKSLRLLRDCGQPESVISVYRDMAAVEQDRGRSDRAVEHLSKASGPPAHAIAMSQCPEELVGAEVSHSMALILSSDPGHNDSAGQHFERSLSIYKTSAGPQDAAFLAVQDDFCRFLLVSGQEEKCLDIQRSSLATKKSTFGDVSVEVADTLELIGSLEMAQGCLRQAHRTMTKCLQIQRLLFGPQHRRSKATQKAVEMLARAPEVAQTQRSRSGDRTKLFSTTAPSRNEESSISD
ncbi:Tetratricopeptide repeat protein 23 [Takifugu flavidus]|uniref:Tetratricopeptide repeat protein 23 n=1 Tax=Takifugu flavidus TaxID=433684 RepID=A0A5C6PAB7_9TELE|nr:Tetratricopeptide repeat protein 23 [Takifugu flavidus]